MNLTILCRKLKKTSEGPRAKASLSRTSMSCKDACCAGDVSCIKACTNRQGGWWENHIKSHSPPNKDTISSMSCKDACCVGSVCHNMNPDFWLFSLLRTWLAVYDLLSAGLFLVGRFVLDVLVYCLSVDLFLTCWFGSLSVGRSLPVGLVPSLSVGRFLPVGLFIDLLVLFLPCLLVCSLTCWIYSLSAGLFIDLLVYPLSVDLFLPCLLVYSLSVGLFLSGFNNCSSISLESLFSSLPYLRFVQDRFVCLSLLFFLLSSFLTSSSSFWYHRHSPLLHHPFLFICSSFPFQLFSTYAYAYYNRKA